MLTSNKLIWYNTEKYTKKEVNPMGDDKHMNNLQKDVFSFELFKIVTDHYNYFGQQFYSEDIEIRDAVFQFVLE